jgi:predicted Zn-dependent peptidase/predicted Ser/Thr protein kinase
MQTAGTVPDPRRPSWPAIEAGSRIGRYVVLGTIGSGGMGVVYLGRDPDLDRLVAIKVMHAQGGAAELRLFREARTLAKLRHPNIVTVHEVGTWNHRPFVAMEYVEGDTLRAWLRSPRTVAERVDALVQAARGLVAAHARGVVHRDFKPDNVIVGKDGRVCVVDFGLAHSAGSTSFSTECGPSGTPGYMPPEQWQGATPDEYADQFAFCATAYEALFGHRAFAGATGAEVRAATLLGPPGDDALPAGVSGTLARALRRGLAPEKSDRHPSMKLLLAALVPRPRTRARAALAVTAVATLGIGGYLLRPSGTGAIADDSRASIFATSHLPATRETALPQDPLQVTVHRLSNGLTVYISPNRKRPTVSAAVVFRAGPVRETPQQRGAARLLVAMAFDGTQRVGTTDWTAERPLLDKAAELQRKLATATGPTRDALLRELDQTAGAASQYQIPDEALTALQDIGGESTSDFSPDALTFTSTVPSNRFEMWAQLEADRWMNRVPRRLTAAVATLLRELRVDRESWLATSSAALRGAVFPGDPYAEDPDALARALAMLPDTERFAHTWLVPNNAAIVLSGDISPHTALPLLERAFADWQPRALPEVAAPPLPEPNATPVDVATSGPRRVLFGWRSVPRTDPQYPLAIALVGLWGRVIGDRMVGPDKLTEVVATLTTYTRAAMVSATGVPREGQTADQAAQVMEDAVEALRAGKFTQADIDAGMLAWETRWLEQHLDNPPRVDEIASIYAAGQDWFDHVQEPARARAVTRDQLVRFANATLARRHVTVRVDRGRATLPPLPELPLTIPQADARGRSAWVGQLLASEVVPIQPRFVGAGRDYTTAATRAGELVTVRDPHSGLFELRLVIDLGTVDDPLVMPAAFLSRLDPGSAELRERMRALGLEIDVISRPRVTWMTLTGADRAFAPGVAVLADLLSRRRFTDDDWRAGMPRYATDMDRINAQPDTLADALADYALHGRAAVLRTRPDPHRLLGVPAARITAAWAKLARAHRSIYYFGPRGEEEVERLVATLAPSNGTRHRAAPVPLAHGRPAVTLLADPAMQRTLTRIYLPVPDANGKELARVYPYGAYISRALYDELATRRRLAADVETTCNCDYPADGLAVVVTLDTEAARATEALEAALAYLRELTIDRDLFAKVRKSLEDSLAGKWIAPEGIARYLATTRLWGDYERTIYEALPALTPDELARIHAELAHVAPAISIHGDLGKLDRARLARIGPLREVTRKEILGM